MKYPELPNHVWKERHEAVVAFIHYIRRMDEHDDIWNTINRMRNNAGAPDDYLAPAKYPIPVFPVSIFSYTAMLVRQLVLSNSKINIDKILGIIASYDKDHAETMKNTLSGIASMRSNYHYYDNDSSQHEHYTLKELFEIFLYGEGIGIAHFSEKSRKPILKDKKTENFVSNSLSLYDNEDTRQRVVLYLFNMQRIAKEAADSLVWAIENRTYYPCNIYIERDYKTKKIKNAKILR